MEIVISCDGQEKRYLLHRLILAQFSGFFEAGMSDEWSRTYALPAPPQPARQEQALTVIGEESGAGQRLDATQQQTRQVVSGRRRWRYELDWTNLEEDEDPILVQRVSDVGRTPYP